MGRHTEYGLFIHSNHLHWLESEKPIIYEVFKKDGKHYATVFSEKSSKEYVNEGYIIKQGDLEKEIKKMKSLVKSLEDKRNKLKKDD